jgi:hypothetical protein
MSIQLFSKRGRIDEQEKKFVRAFGEKKKRWGEFQAFYILLLDYSFAHSYSNHLLNV